MWQKWLINPQHIVLTRQLLFVCKYEVSHQHVNQPIVTKCAFMLEFWSLSTHSSRVPQEINGKFWENWGLVSSALITLNSFERDSFRVGPTIRNKGTLFFRFQWHMFSIRKFSSHIISNLWIDSFQSSPVSELTG